MPTEQPLVPKKLTVRNPDAIRALIFNDADRIVGDSVITRGAPCCIVGPPGIGKSRLLLQLAVANLAGYPNAIGLENKNPEQRWLIIQAENSNRRLKTDLDAYAAWVGPERWARVNERLFLHTLETDYDGILSLEDIPVRKMLIELVGDTKPTVVAWDCLQSFAIGELNHDADMYQTLSVAGQISKLGDPTRATVILHHAAPGRQGAARALGFEKGAYGRNSKAMFGWTRSQVNLAPGTEDGLVVVVGCGKLSDGQEWEPFALRLNTRAMVYEKDDEFNLLAWRSEMLRTAPSACTPEGVAAIAGNGGKPKDELVKAIMETVDCSKSAAYRAVTRALGAKTVFHVEESDRYVACLPPV